MAELAPGSLMRLDRLSCSDRASRYDRCSALEGLVTWIDDCHIRSLPVTETILKKVITRVEEAFRGDSHTAVSLQSVDLRCLHTLFLPLLTPKFMF